MLWWTLQNIVVTAILAIAVAVICRAGRIGPVARHALWLVVLVKLITPPMVVWPWALPQRLAFAPDPSSVSGGGTADSAGSAAASRSVHAIVVPDTVRSFGGPAPRGASLRPASVENIEEVRPPQVRPSEVRPPVRARATSAASAAGAAVIRATSAYGAAIWIAGALVFAALQIVRIVRLGVALRRADPAPPAIAERVAMLAQRLRLRPVRVRTLPGIASPLMWGLGRPELLWPAASMHGLSESSLRGLIVHELAHVKRRDHWVGWLELVAGCVWWWNPLFWIVRHQLRENAELACDAWVVHAVPHSRRAYAEAIVTVCERLSRPLAPMPAVGVSTGSRRFLERRLAMIMQERVSLRLPRVGLLSVAVLAVVALPAWAQRAVTPAPTPDRSSPPAAISAVQVPIQAGAVTPVAGIAGLTPAVTQVRSAAAAEQTLPADARRLMDQFSRQEMDIQRDADARIAQQRQDLIRQLQALQERHTRAGELDEALAVRNQVRRLQQAGPRARGPRAFASMNEPLLRGDRIEASGNFTAYRADNSRSSFFTFSRLRDRIGESFTIPIVGSSRGNIWGNGVYTDDSAVATAAVHAGLVEPGRLGFVRVTILPGQAQYGAAVQHGVESQPWSEWHGSYRLERAATPAVIRLPGGFAVSLPELRGHNGVSLTTEVVGDDGPVWGTDVYTDDSSIGAAAVHAGILRPGERGLVKVTLLPGQDRYAGSDRHGVRTDDYGAWPGSFKIERGAGR